jgi:hypothetical protein
MTTELENLVGSFRAVLAETIIKHRGPYVSAFVKDVTGHVERYRLKLNNLQADAANVDQVRRQIGQMAKDVVDRASAANNVDLVAI